MMGRILLLVTESVQRAYVKGHAFVMATTVVVASCAGMLSCKLNRDYSIYSDIVASDEVAAGGLPIMQGVTTENQTQIFVLTERSNDYLFSLTDRHGNEIFPSAANRVVYRDSTQEIQRLLFQGLSPDSAYLFQAHSARDEELLDERELRTLTPGRQDLRFAFGSCMLDYYFQGDIWQQMVELNPDVIFLIGDNVYADVLKDMATPDDLWTRNFEVRNRLGLFKNKKLVPVVAVWDDHDYGMNNAGLDYPYKEESLSVFKTFFASEDTRNFYMPGIGAASFFSIYGYNFFLLDNRTFRTAKGSSPEWHFGEVQSQWLRDNLVGKDSAFLISGDQFFGGYSPKDSFQGHHPERFLDFLSELKDINTKVVFLSGDRHFTEIMEIPAEMLGYKTYELTSSPIHAFTKPFVFPNPLRIEGRDKVVNFMLVEASKIPKGLHLNVTSYTLRGAVLFNGDYTID